MAAALTITEYTDPACPWAFSAEPFRWKLSWMYGDQLHWEVRMVGLSENPEDALARGFAPEVLSQALAHIAAEHKMPIDTSLRERMSASIPACRAVVAARLNAPAEQTFALLRALRVRSFSGELLDAPETIDAAATAAGIDPAALRDWMADRATQAALDEDLAAARQPTPAALVQDERLADWSGGRRYTCPSYELEAAGEQLSAPGFQPFRVYDMATANLVPGAERRAKPESVAELLTWAGTPLATQEVAIVCELSLDDAREALSAVATETPVGEDGYWTLAAAA
jgi:predicted DsbA family dithiol-disulfide isomerase